jgi:bifunctional UDP-N-acetylglucosamine pyrophosphorylase/glucosamine-1-phosphate N-acetyltransferase
MLEHVISTLKSLNVKKIYVVVGHQKELITDYFKDHEVAFVEQNEQLGTGHAVMQAEPFLKDFEGEVLILAGDVPLLKAKTVKKLINFHREHHSSATVLTAEVPEAAGYGRIIRNQDGLILKIVEKKDANEEQLKIKEINTGTFCFNSKALFAALSEVKSENAQKEFYLTDTIQILREKGLPVFACLADDYRETLGVNTVDELKELERLAI